jgi:hypothetical protein
LHPEEWDVAHDEPLGNIPLLRSRTEAARALFNLHVAPIRLRLRVVGDVR